MEKNVKYNTKVEYDSITGEYYIELDNKMLQEMDWRVGDNLEWIIDDNSNKQYILINKSKEERDRGNNDSSI